MSLITKYLQSNYKVFATDLIYKNQIIKSVKNDNIYKLLLFVVFNCKSKRN